MWSLDVKNVIICGLIAVLSYQNNNFGILDKYLGRLDINSYKNKLHLNQSDLDIFKNNEINDRLHEHTKLFSKKEIIKVNDHVYVGIGYGLANCIVIECDSSYIIVDTLESINGAIEFRNDFNKLYNNSDNAHKGISNIIFTHYHADHTQGTPAFIDDANNPPTIISHAFTKKGLHRVNSIQSSIVYTRAMRQFGTITKEYDNMHKMDNNSDDSHSYTHLHVNSGIGPQLKVGEEWEKSILMPTKTLDAKFTEMEIDGVILHIYYAPGETDDQIFIYLPQSGTLLPADNIYETFPNLYAIRGSPTRDARKWIESLDMMRYLHLNHNNNNGNDNGNGILYMVPSHTRPVYGHNAIYNLLTVYRDGIQYIHDQTLRFMNKGLTPNEMIPIIKHNMPLRLKLHPWLFEFYGTFDWSIRAIFDGYLGWFTGDAAELFPLSKSIFAQNIILLLKEFNDNNKNNNNNENNENNNENNNGNYDNLIEFLLDYADSSIKTHQNSEDCQFGLDIATNIMHLKDDLMLYNKFFNFDLHNNGEHSASLFIKLTDDLYQRSKNLRIKGLKCMASFQLSANGRNYYLTSALEDSGNFRIKPTRKVIEATVTDFSLDFLFDAMTVRFKIESLDKSYLNQTACFVFDITDDKLEYDIKSYQNNNNDSRVYSWYKIEFRDGIIESFKGGDTEKVENSKFGWLLTKQQCIDDSDLAMSSSSAVYRELAIATRRSPAMLYAQGEIKVMKGSVLALKAFSDSFDHE